MSKNIVLIGFMGSGKSVAANELAKRRGLKVVSTDDLIENRESMSIIEIFANKGEAYFREVESAVIAEAVKDDGVVIDCGGGAFLNQENIKTLKAKGVTIYLQASASQIYERTKGMAHRPLLNVEDPKARIIELLDQREAFYGQADHTIATDKKTNEQVCDEIEEILDNE